MRLHYLIICSSIQGVKYTRPKWKQLLELMKNPKYSQITDEGIDIRSTISWGRPQTGSFISHNLCPPLDIPVGADRLFCNGSTCVVECKPGYQPGKGAIRTQCRTRKDTFGAVVEYWTTPLARCITCDEEMNLKQDVSSYCYISSGSNEKICDVRSGCKKCDFT